MGNVDRPSPLEARVKLEANPALKEEVKREVEQDNLVQVKLEQCMKLEAMKEEGEEQVGEVKKEELLEEVKEEAVVKHAEVKDEIDEHGCGLENLKYPSLVR